MCDTAATAAAAAAPQISTRDTKKERKKAKERKKESTVSEWVSGVQFGCCCCCCWLERRTNWPLANCTNTHTHSLNPYLHRSHWDSKPFKLMERNSQSSTVQFHWFSRETTEQTDRLTKRMRMRSKEWEWRIVQLQLEFQYSNRSLAFFSTLFLWPQRTKGAAKLHLRATSLQFISQSRERERESERVKWRQQQLKSQ